jgi:N-acetylmuramoyl-L-alanine amidase
MKNRFYLILIIIILSSVQLLSSRQKSDNYLIAKPKKGDGVTILLNRYLIPPKQEYISLFLELNEGNVPKGKSLLIGVKYKLPVKCLEYNGKNIRSSVGINDADVAKNIENYNARLLSKGLIKKDYRESGNIYVPMMLLNEADSPAPQPQVAEKPAKKSKTKKVKVIDKDTVEEYTSFKQSTLVKPTTEVYFGKKYQDITLIDKSLAGHVYYLDSGHGGPDPGAVGECGNKRLCEDEYAYDVILRLARNLMQHGATVYVIVQDPKDGIRDELYLNCDEDEKYIGGYDIPNVQLDRLKLRTDIVNDLYAKNRKKAKSQTEIVIHLDSRTLLQRIDIFFYYQEEKKESRQLAETLYGTIKNKYDKNQPGRGYHGTVTTRNLYQLKNTKPNTVYLELGNIQNTYNQERFIQPNNRQAIANWLCQGLIKASKTKSED